MFKTFTEWLKIREVGVGPYIGGCGQHADFQVLGACSDQKGTPRKRKKKKKTDQLHVDSSE